MAIFLCACTQDFDKFLDGSASGGDASDAASCDVEAKCIASANACGQSCLTGESTCVNGCSNQSCKSQCKNQETTCNGVCVSTCVSCADAGTCAQTPCQSALP